MSRGDCPKCERPLQHGGRGGLPSRNCSSCGARWVEILQLESLTEKVPVADELLRVYAELSTQELAPADRACPSCEEALLRGSYSRVDVDVCRACKGLFLDAHELEGVIDPMTTRPCPKCEAPMRAEEINGVPTNSCRGCGGRWLEVPMIEHLGELSSEARLTRDALIRTFASLHDEPTSETVIPCPTCTKTLESCFHQGIELDFCFSCRGLFVDSGEMEQVAESGGSAAERAVAAATSGAGRALNGLVGSLVKLFG